MSGLVYDLAIIGGGINGVSIARDAAGRGLSVFLCEQGDLGGATSSASTGLIHGGFRDLEKFAFRQVREALAEREVLLRAAPHIVRPMRFVLPHHKGMRRRWLIRGELFAYDHLGGRQLLPPSRTLELASEPAGQLLQDHFTAGFEYSDCRVDDARLVVLNAMDAQNHGASINPGLRCVIAEREGRGWRLSLESLDGDDRSVVMARALVNAAGPWVAEVFNHVVHGNRTARVSLVKGSHIVVPKVFDDDRGFVFQNSDGRVVFALPYEGEFTLIGTTEEEFHGDPGDVAADSAEIAYLTATASAYFRHPVYEDQIVWSYSGVRAIHDDGAGRARRTPRDHVLDLDAADGRPPVLSVFGGKITTSRRLAEQVVDLLRPTLAASPPWTAGATLPGGSFDVDGIPDLARALRAAYPFIDDRLAARLVRAYGTLAQSILSGARRSEDLGRVLGADLTEAEARYLMTAEWARSADDILWRRSKLGLRFTPGDVAALEDWLTAEHDRSMDARIARAGA